MDRLTEKIVTFLDGSQEEVKSDGRRRVFVGSFVVKHETNRIEHDILKIEALSYEEALGRAYLKLRDKYPATDGYGPPDLKIDGDALGWA